MDVLRDSRGEPVANYLKNWIIDVTTSHVLGVVLGHCVFDSTGKVCGKFFKGTLRDLSGEKIASVENSNPDSSEKEKLAALMDQAWDIISKIDDHTCPDVEEKNDWSAVTLRQLLNVA